MAKKRKVSSVRTSAMSSAVPSRLPSRTPTPEPVEPFRFFDLPSELRLRIYELLLLVSEPIDLDPLNHRLIHPRFILFLVSHRMHEEAYRVFYAQSFRLFPVQSRFYHTKYPLLQRLPVRYRNEIATMELRLGPGWTNPPRCQNVKPSLGLADCCSLRTLKIMVELDPSDNVFVGFRGKDATEETYKWFCVDLLVGIMDQVPSLLAVELDAYPAVKKDAPLVSALVREVKKAGKRLIWGPLRGWDKDADEPGLIGLESAMASMSISPSGTRVIAVEG